MIIVRTYLAFTTKKRGGQPKLVEISQCDSLPPRHRGSGILGSIEININGVEVVGKTLVDDIEWLWGYVAEMVEKYRATGEASTYFPDQSIELIFKRIEHELIHICLLADTRRAAATNERDFLFALHQASEVFFDKMEALTQNFYPQQRNKLRMQ